MEYKIPEQFYFRIHHARPRFKNDIENVKYIVYLTFLYKIRGKGLIILHNI